MIGKLTGTYGGEVGGVALIEVGGVGYSVRVPLHTLPPHQGGITSLYIHTAVRDDAIDLYGFVTEEELQFFKQLMSVSGVGPKTALGILNVADVLTLKRAIAHGDAAALTKVFGMGKKSAERIVVELRDKLSSDMGTASGATAGSTDAEVVEALMALGYAASECREALKKLGTDSTASLKERLGAALRQLSTSTV